MILVLALQSSVDTAVVLAVPWYDAIRGHLLFHVNNSHGSFQIWETTVDRKMILKHDHNKIVTIKSIYGLLT